MNPDSDDNLRAAVNSSLLYGTSQLEIRADSKALKGKREVRDQAKLRRSQAMWDAYHVDGKEYLEISAALIRAHQDAGQSAAQIGRLGISHDAIRNIVGSRRDPKPRPQA